MAVFIWVLFTAKIIIAKPLEAGKNIDEKSKILMRRKTLLKKVKSYINNHLGLTRKNIDPGKEYFVQPLSIPVILAELHIDDTYYYRALSSSKDDEFELHMKRNPNSCSVNNYVNGGLKF